MKIYIKRSLLLFSLISICSITPLNASSAYASVPIEAAKTNNNFDFFKLPNTFENSWPGFQKTYANLTISKLGVADFETSVIPSKSSYYSKITMTLQIYKNGSWKTLFSGTHGEKGSHMYERIYYVLKGYKYRTKSVIKMYKSKNGKLINTDTIYSKTKKR